MSKSKSQRRKTQRLNKSRSFRGGNSAADHGVSVYGGPGNQHAIPGTNLIRVNYVGGRKKKRSTSCKKSRKNK